MLEFLAISKTFSAQSKNSGRKLWYLQENEKSLLFEKLSNKVNISIHSIPCVLK